MRKLASALTLLLVLNSQASSKQNPDFSGTYTLQSVSRSDSSTRHFPKNIPVGKQTLQVIQTGNSLEASFVSETGTTSTRKYKLDGSESENVDFDGTPTTDRASVKGNTLVVRSSIKVKAGALKGVPVDQIQKWGLSPDLKTLTVRQQIHLHEGIPEGDATLTMIYVRQ